jgi:hydrogenase maturation protease
VTGAVLVIGYGNVLRSDDGLGWYVAERLAHDHRFVGATVLPRHQLTPELAFDCSRADLVILVDASHGPAAGSFAIAPIDPADDGSTTWSHHLGPGTLLALAEELYGRAPVGFAVSVGVESLETGEQLSPAVEAALPEIVDAIAGLVSTWRARAIRDAVHA